MYTQSLVKDSVRNTEGKVDRLILEVMRIIEKLNDISLRLARIEAKKKG